MGSNPALYANVFGHKRTRMAGNDLDPKIGNADGYSKETESSSCHIWQYFAVSNSSDP